MSPPDRNFHYFPSGSEDRKQKRFPGWAVIGIFLILLFFFIADARAFLMPVTLGILLFFVFTPFRRMMERRRINATITAAIVTLGMIITVAGIGYVVSGPAGQLIDDAPRISQQLKQKYENLRSNFKGLEDAAAQIEKLSTGEISEAAGGTASAVTDGSAVATTADAPEVKVQVQASPPGNSTVMNALAMGPSAFGQVAFTLIFLFFLISSGDLLYLKIVQSFDTMKEKRAAYLALREIEESLGAYLGSITIINAGLGITIGVAMWLWDMPSPVLWGIGGFLFNFIPYIGAIGGTLAAFLVALVVFDDLFTPIMIGLTYLSLTSIEGQFVTPYFVSRRLQLNTVVVFLTVALWAWLWSVLGMIVAVPVLVVLRVLSEHIPSLEKFGNFLAGEDPPELEDEDEEEAREIVETGAEQSDLEGAEAALRN